MSDTCAICGGDHGESACEFAGVHVVGPETQETGGQPSPETVVEAHEETMSRANRIDRHILSQQWRFGKMSRTIVCDPLPGQVVSEGARRNGGMMVLEGCPDAIREHIIRLHNEWLANHNLTI